MCGRLPGTFSFLDVLSHSLPTLNYTLSTLFSTLTSLKWKIYKALKSDGTCSQMKPSQKLIFSNLNLRLFHPAGMYIASECNTLKVICAGVHCIQTEPKIALT